MSVIFCDRCQRLVDLDEEYDHMEDHDTDDGEEMRPERQGGDPLPNVPGFSGILGAGHIRRAEREIRKIGKGGK